MYAFAGEEATIECPRHVSRFQAVRCAGFIPRSCRPRSSGIAWSMHQQYGKEYDQDRIRRASPIVSPLLLVSSAPHQLCWGHRSSIDDAVSAHLRRFVKLSCSLKGSWSLTDYPVRSASVEEFRLCPRGSALRPRHCAPVVASPRPANSSPSKPNGTSSWASHQNSHGSSWDTPH